MLLVLALALLVAPVQDPVREVRFVVTVPDGRGPVYLAGTWVSVFTRSVIFEFLDLGFTW